MGTKDVHEAAERIEGHIRRTPLLELHGIALKAEHLQHAGSFKARGATNAALALGADDIVTGSSGNHGIALATLGRALGARVTVVMAAGACPAKADLLRSLGARVVGVPGGVAERDQHARELATRTGAAFIPSSDHELVVAGQGTVGLEILSDAPDADTIFVPTGGGGLLAGVCLATAGTPTRVVGVEPAGGRRYALSLAAGRPVEIAPPDTVADGLRGQRPGEVTFPVVRDLVHAVIGVTDAEITHALALLRRAGIAAEPSGAVALAGALRSDRTHRAVAVVSGGNTKAAFNTETALSTRKESR